MDVVCPWCYIGKRRLEKALASVGPAPVTDLVFHSFELDPQAPIQSDQSFEEIFASKYGMTLDESRASNDRVAKLAAEEGLEYHLDMARPTNTLDAHRLLQLANIRRIRPVVEERFQRAYFTEGASLSDHATLLRLSAEAGLSEFDARRVLAGKAFTLQVRLDEKDAQDLGASGVPFYAFDRQRTVSGLQPMEVFLKNLQLEGN